LSSRTGTGCSELDAGEGDMFAESLMGDDGGGYGGAHLMDGRLVLVSA
jgi:hypothetical protein